MSVMRSKPIILGICAALALVLSGAAQPNPEEPVPEEPAEAATPEAVPDEGAVPSLDSKDFLPPADDSATPSADDDPAEPGAPEADTSAPAATAAKARGVPLKGKPPTREFLVGVWAEQGQRCEAGIDFKADGTMIGPFPRWELNDGGELTMVGNRQKIWLTVVDSKTIHTRRSAKDPPRTLKRC